MALSRPTEGLSRPDGVATGGGASEPITDKTRAQLTASSPSEGQVAIPSDGFERSGSKIEYWYCSSAGSYDVKAIAGERPGFLLGWDLDEKDKSIARPSGAQDGGSRLTGSTLVLHSRLGQDDGTGGTVQLVQIAADEASELQADNIQFHVYLTSGTAGFIAFETGTGSNARIDFTLSTDLTALGASETSEVSWYMIDDTAGSGDWICAAVQDGSVVAAAVGQDAATILTDEGSWVSCTAGPDGGSAGTYLAKASSSNLASVRCHLSNDVPASPSTMSNLEAHSAAYFAACM